MKWILIILAVAAVLLVLAWLSSGRAKARQGQTHQLSETEKDDALRQNQRRQQGAGGAF